MSDGHELLGELLNEMRSLRVAHQRAPFDWLEGLSQ
jgi:hypothetical protein